MRKQYARQLDAQRCASSGSCRRTSKLFSRSIERDLTVRQRTQLANMIRSLLREFGHILPIGIKAVTAFAKPHLAEDNPDMPEIATGMLGIQCYQFIGLNERIDGCSKVIEQHALLRAG